MREEVPQPNTDPQPPRDVQFQPYSGSRWAEHNRKPRTKVKPSKRVVRAKRKQARQNKKGRV